MNRISTIQQPHLQIHLCKIIKSISVNKSLTAAIEILKNKEKTIKADITNPPYQIRCGGFFYLLIQIEELLYSKYAVNKKERVINSLF